MIQRNDDGLVPVESVESQEYFQSLGRTEHGHTEMLSEKEYQSQRIYYLERSSMIVKSRAADR